MSKKPIDIDAEFDDVHFDESEIIRATANLKISIANKDRKKPIRTVEHRRNISEVHKGMTHSIESRKKISRANIGKILSKEICQKMSISKTGKKKPPHSKETKKQISNTKIKLQGVKCVAIDPTGIRYEFDSIKECEISLNYKNLTPNAVNIFPIDGSQKIGKGGKWKGWTFFRIV